MGRLQQAASTAHRIFQQLGGTSGIKNDRPVNWSTSMGKVNHPDVKTILQKVDNLRYLEGFDQEAFQAHLSRDFLSVAKDIGAVCKKRLKQNDKANINEATEFLAQKRGLYKALQNEEIGVRIETKKVELAALASGGTPPS